MTGAVAIVGAGMAGLACARVLFGAQHPVTVLEKSRVLGGRLATRRNSRLAFDHGAQYVVARDPGFQDYLDLACATGHVRSWLPIGPGLPRMEPWMVGCPGMSALVKPLAAGLDVRRGLRVTACARRGDEWWLASESGDPVGPFAALLLAVPAPQAVELVGDMALSVDIAGPLGQVRMAPCWAAMIAFPERFDAPADILDVATGPLAWGARDTGKPERSSPHDCWVMHATADWTRAHLDDSSAEVAEVLLLEFQKRVGTTPRGAYASAYLWRFARVEQPLGEPCMWDPELRLGLCGDWCLDARVEAAWISGVTLARKVLEDVTA